MPLLSIIVPVYNTATYLPACLDSILSQGFTDFEVLLVDDGSSDGSEAICDRYAEADSRVRVFHQENGGVSSARNLGLSQAKGEWIYFVDSDDEMLPDGLQTLVDCISDDVDIVMGGILEVEENGYSPKVPEKTVKILSKRESIITLYGGYGSCYSYCGYMCMRLLRRRIIEEFKLTFDTSIAIKEDTLFLMQYICESNGITRQTTTPVYKYCKRNDSAMGKAQKGFDMKYVTSFYALIKMKHEVAALFPFYSVPVFVAKQAVYGRCEHIIDCMEANQIQNDSMKNELRLMMKDEMGSVFLFKLRRRIRKLIKI